MGFADGDREVRFQIDGFVRSRSWIEPHFLPFPPSPQKTYLKKFDIVPKLSWKSLGASMLEKFWVEKVLAMIYMMFSQFG